MKQMHSLARIAVLPAFGLALLAAGGCGDGSPADPEGGVKLKQARIAAYGPSGTPSGKGSSLNTQAAARQRAQGGR